MLPLALQTNSMLDDNYDLARKENRPSDAALISGEIVKRLADVQSYLYGAFGINEFPKYGQWANFDQTSVVQGGLKTSVETVATSIGSTLSKGAKTIGGLGWDILKPVALTAVALSALVYLIKKPRKGEK